MERLREMESESEGNITPDRYEGASDMSEHGEEASYGDDEDEGSDSNNDSGKVHQLV